MGLENQLIGNSYDLTILINSKNKSSNKYILDFISPNSNLTYLKELKVESDLLPKKLFSSLVNYLNNKKDLIEFESIY